MTELAPEDQKLVTLARTTRSRTGGPEGAAVRDSDGRTYAAATVTLPSYRETNRCYIRSRQEAPPTKTGGLPRRLYEATALGRRVLSAWTRVARELLPEFAR